MLQPEFDAVTALEKVRQLRRSLNELDIFVSENIKHDEYSDLTGMVRVWEQRLLASITITTPRKRRKGKANVG